MGVSEQYYSFNKNNFNVNDEILVDTSGRNILIDPHRIVFDGVQRRKNNSIFVVPSAILSGLILSYIMIYWEIPDIDNVANLLNVSYDNATFFTFFYLFTCINCLFIVFYRDYTKIDFLEHTCLINRNYYDFYGIDMGIISNYKYNKVKNILSDDDFELWKQAIIVEKDHILAEKILKRAVDNKDYQRNRDTILHDSSSDSKNNYRISVKDRIDYVLKEFSELSLDFTNIHTNPEIVIYKPLLLDSDQVFTKNMINSFNALREEMDKRDYEYNIDTIEFLLDKAKKYFSYADSEARRIGIPGVSSDSKRRAEKSLNIVLDESATVEERISHWESIVKIVTASGIKRENISKISKEMVLTINPNYHYELEYTTL